LRSTDINNECSYTSVVPTYLHGVDKHNSTFLIS